MIEGNDWKEMCESYNEMSRAVGVRKPHEVEKAKALWKMKEAKQAGEEYYDPERHPGEKQHDFGKNTSKIRLWHRIKLKIRARRFWPHYFVIGMHSARRSTKVLKVETGRNWAITIKK